MMSLQLYSMTMLFSCLVIIFSNDCIQVILVITLDFYGVVSFKKVSPERLLRQKLLINNVK